VTDVYTAPFPFAGILHRVVYDVSGEPVTDHEAKLRIAHAANCQPASEGDGAEASSAMSFLLSFHLPVLGPTRAHWLDDPPDVTCRDSTRQHAMDDIARYIELRYNTQRLHSGLGYKTPHEVHTEYLNQQLAA